MMFHPSRKGKMKLKLSQDKKIVSLKMQNTDHECQNEQEENDEFELCENESEGTELDRH